jgi:predicted RNA-binding Zn ribbon-like protein
MPQVRKLAPEEVQTIENKGKGLRKLTEEQYDAFLRDYEVGDYGEAQLDEGEKRLTVRNRLKAAAGRRNVAIEFRRTTGDLLRFKIASQSDGQAAPVQLPAVVSSPCSPSEKTTCCSYARNHNGLVKR